MGLAGGFSILFQTVAASELGTQEEQKEVSPFERSPLADGRVACLSFLPPPHLVAALFQAELVTELRNSCMTPHILQTP